MKHALVFTVLIGVSALSVAPDVEGARVVVRKGRHTTRVRVTTRPGFPIRRTMPTVVVRPAPVVRVAPRVYLTPVPFAAVVVASAPAPDARIWAGDETLEREDGWTDFTMNVDRRGERLLLEIDRGAAQISFAEVVFDNGDAQVVDFNDRVHGAGAYSVLEFRDGRKVDHVRVVAKADTRESVIRLYLVV